MTRRSLPENVVSLIFDLKEQNLSWNEIAEKVNSLGYNTNPDSLRMVYHRRSQKRDLEDKIETELSVEQIAEIVGSDTLFKEWMASLDIIRKDKSNPGNVMKAISLQSQLISLKKGISKPVDESELEKQLKIKSKLFDALFDYVLNIMPDKEGRDAFGQFLEIKERELSIGEVTIG